MSSIKKYDYVSEEWRKFAETNALQNDLSNANNISVDFGSQGSVNDMLLAHDSDIQKLKRNVAWLALHGGGGSGGGGGGGSVVRKASCKIFINGTSKQVSISKGQAVIVTLENFVGSDQSVPWTTTVTFDGDNNQLYYGSVTPVGDKITIEIPWSGSRGIERFFEGSGGTRNHRIKVTTKYFDPSTSLEGDAALESIIYIPQIVVDFQPESQYDSSDPSKCKAKITIRSALMGNFLLSADSVSMDDHIQYDGYLLPEKSTDELTASIDMLEAYKQGGSVKVGIYDTTFTLIYKKDDETTEQPVYTATKKIVVFSRDIAMLVNFTNLSNKKDDEKQWTKVYDNTKNLMFSFMAFKAGSEGKSFEYTIDLLDKSGMLIKRLVDGAIGPFGLSIPINKTIEAITADHGYDVEITIRAEGSDPVVATGYIKCVKGAFSFIEYTDAAQKSRVFSLNSFSYVYDEGIKPVLPLTCYNTQKENIENCVSSTLYFNQINSRSGFTSDEDGVRALRLFDTYMSVDDQFKYKAEEHGEVKETVDTLSSMADFTICLCYQSQKYFTNDHVIFSLCNKGDVLNGIAVKNDGIYIKNNKELALHGEQPNIIHIVYHNESPGEGMSAQKNWNKEKGYIKIYVNGVITYMDSSCPFPEEENPSTKISEIQNSELKLLFSGYTPTSAQSSRQHLCNFDLYDIEIFKSRMNELDILASFINNKIRTTYVNRSPDFTVLDTELKKNCCSYNQETKVIESQIYTAGDYSQFTFDGVLLKDGEVPWASTSEEVAQWVDKLSSLSLPVVYIDFQDSKSGGEIASQWTFDYFMQRGCEPQTCLTKFHYWDPKTGQMPISSDNVAVNIQGTSTKEDRVKNVEITFQTQDKGKVVQDLFFVRSDWLPENSYVLKADVVDSSHANNASIGKFINDHFERGNEYEFDFDATNIQQKNITKSITQLKDERKWAIEPKLRHTVEGFQTLLFIRFYDQTTFFNLGIYSFNIGRNAARNLGFEYITDILKLKDGTTDTEPVENATAPAILQDVIVEQTHEDEVYWVENSDSQNFEGTAQWNTTTKKITPDPTRATNPSNLCRFWHAPQSDEDVKLNQLFEVKYSNTVSKPAPKGIETFSKFVTEVSKLPIEGLMNSSAVGKQQSDITGEYTTAICLPDGENVKWEDIPSPHTLNTEVIDADVAAFSPDHFIKYFAIAMLFGLVDNLDKNMSLRVFKNNNGETDLFADFYDMDTALGLNNVGEEKVSPTVGFKLLANERNDLAQDYPQETFNTEKVKALYPEYTQYLPEVFTSKLWLSLDSIAMRTLKQASYSLYANAWFQLRNYLDNIAINTYHYSSFVDYFADKYFESQLNCGTFLYNYDYTIKYLNDFQQTGVKQSDNTISKLHGRRIDTVKQWLSNHIDFLDTYFYWRNNQSFVRGSAQSPAALKSVVNDKISLTTNSAVNTLETTTTIPVVVHSSSTADAGVGDTLTNPTIPFNLKIGGGSTGKPFQMNCSGLLRNFDLKALGIRKFRTTGNSKITCLEELLLDGLTIAEDGISLDDFIEDGGSPNALVKISMNGTKFSRPFALDLNEYQLLNISYVDIADSENIRTLNFYQGSGSEDKLTQNLSYLAVDGSSIENLNIKNQSYLVLPTFNNCQNLITFNVENCNFDNFDPSKKADPKNYLAVNLSAQSAIKRITAKETECIKSIAVNKCPSFEELNLQNISSLSSIAMDQNAALTSLTITDCPDLQSLNVTECKSLREVEILSATSLTAIDFNYDSSLTSIHIDQSSVRNIKTINLRNVNIRGFNYFDYSTRQWQSILTDLNGNRVLDFKPFQALNSDGITLQRNGSGAYSSDKCANFEAIRFPNNKAKAYNYVSNDSSGSFTSLQNVYGHINITGSTFYSSDNNPQDGLFVTEWESEKPSYTGCPPFLSVILDRAKKTSLDLTATTVFDMIEKSTSIGSKLSCDNLSAIESNIVNGFLTIPADKIEEFDTREWATNYTFSGSLGANDLNQYSAGAMQGRTLDEFEMQYFLYRYAIYHRQQQKDGTSLGTRNFTSYVPSNFSKVSQITLPENTFKYFGKTVTLLCNFLTNSSSTKPFKLTRKMLKWIPSLETFNGFTPNDSVDYDAFFDCKSLTQLGNTIADGPKIANLVITNDSKNQFFSQMNALKTISHFNPSSFHLSGYCLPSNVQTVANSFTKQTADELIDPVSVFYDCTALTGIYGSFGSATIVLKPKSFNQMTQLKRLDFSNANKKYIVENDILDLWDYWKDGQFNIDTRDYTQEQFSALMSRLLSANTQLTSTVYLLANSTIPYQNVYNGEYSISTTTDLFKHNKKLENISYLMKDAQFLYGIAGDMFNGLTNLNTASYAFASNQSLTAGVNSDIPYHMFFQTEAKQTKTLAGTDRFGDSFTPYKLADFNTNMKKTWWPERDRQSGSTSDSYEMLCEHLSGAGLFNEEAFNAVSAKYLDGEDFVDLLHDLSDWEDFCPVASVSVDSEGILSILFSKGSEPLVKTLSTLNASLSVTANWKNDLCKIQTVTHSYMLPSKKLKYLDGCFTGNINIKPYNGPIVTIANELYSPWYATFNSSTNALEPNATRNIYTEDDSWSQNGAIWIDKGEGYVIDETNFISTHYNSSDESMEIVSCDMTSHEFDKGEGQKVIFEGGILRSMGYSVEGTTKQWPDYYASPKAVTEFHYICAPDLFRYCDGNGITQLSGIFNDCDIMAKGIEYGQGEVDPVTGESAFDKSLRGRLPPNLLWPLPYLTGIPDLFKNCYHITSYKKWTGEVDKSGNKTWKTYYIPEGFFAKSPKVSNFTRAFRGNLINYQVELGVPFSDLTGGKLATGTKFNIDSMFACSVWKDAGTIDNFLRGIYFSNIDRAFYCYLDGKSTTNDYLVRNVGVAIGSDPTFSIFDEVKRVPEKITCTYRGRPIVKTGDVAWATKDNDGAVKPSKKT